MKQMVREIMTSTVITAKEDMLVIDEIKLLLRWHISGLPIVESGKVVGIMSRRDIIRYMDQVYSRLVADEETEIEI